jgi:hypothetical protein
MRRGIEIQRTMDKNFDIAYDQLKKLAITQEFSMSDFTMLVMATMNVVEDLSKDDPQLRGIVKKKLAISLVKKLAKDIAEGQRLSEKDKKALDLAIETMLPNVIDGLIDASKGKLFINLRKKVRKHFLLCCGSTEK